MREPEAVPSALKTALSGLLLLALLSSPLPVSSAQKLTLSGPPTCQQGQTCTYTAKGGAGPYTFTMVDGSVGSVTPDGKYTAPAHVVPKQVINGCQGTPNNSVFNTRIDALPVHANSAVWMSNMDANSLYYSGGERIHGSTVLSTDPSMKMSFLYTPETNGPYIYVPFPHTVAESGTDIPGGLLGPPGRDEHILTTYRDTCKQQEVYQLYQSNLSTSNPGGNSQSGVIYSLTNFAHPGYGTDAAETYISPLTVHLDELLAAEAGNLDAIQHAVRVTEDVASIDASVGIWPAQSPGGFAGCRGQNWNITSDGTGGITGTGFNLAWPAGMPVIVNGGSNAVGSVSSATAMTLAKPLKAGSFTMSLPHTDCPPYGARFRLKASFNWPGFDGLCPNVSCRNVVNALLRSVQRYGVVLTDIGTNGNTDYDGGQYTSNDIGNAFREIYTKVLFGKNNFEAVDESALNTRQGGGAADQKWMEASLTNGIVTPDDAAVIQVTDGAGNKATHSVALQGVAIGVPNPVEVVMAGSGPIQFTPWVTGSSNPGFTCSLSGQRSAGAITNRCLYTPPPRAGITNRTDLTVTVTAAADTTVTKTFQVTLLPVARDGNLYISVGKAGYPGHFYTDNNGMVWWNDAPPDLPLALFPDYSTGGGGGTWTGANSDVAPGIYTQGEMGVTMNDLHFSVWVPNGNVAGTVFLANIQSVGPNRQSFSFDCNGNRILGVTDVFTYTGSKGAHSAAPLSCISQVTNGMLHMTLRWQGVNMGADPCCTQPVYHTAYDGVWAAGLMINAGGGPQARPRTPAAILPSFHLPRHFRLAVLVLALLLSMAIVGFRFILRPSKR
jgi:hypothetical protein